MIPAYSQNYTVNPYGGGGWWSIYPPNPGTVPAQPMPQTQPQPQQNQSAGLDGFAFVQGENAALAYIVPAGKTYLLIDTVEDRIYFKSADAYGRPSPLNDFWLTKTKPDAAPVPSETQAEETTAPEYVTREEFDALKEQFDVLAAKKTAGRPRKAEEGEAE